MERTYNCSSNGIDLTTDLKLDKCENLIGLDILFVTIQVKI